LNKLQKVKSLNNGEYQACCPAHQDNNPSLNLKQVDDRILVTCQAGCQVEAIMQSLGLRLSDLFIKSETVPKELPPRVVKEYNYTDKDGNLLYQVVRLEPKSFRQRHKDASGAWIWNMEGVSRVLYHLDMIYKEWEQPIYLVEGEKDADNLIEWGIIATTSAGGAGNWKPEYADSLIDKKVVIIPDKDAAGYGYALKAAESLQGKAKSVSVIILPGDNVKDASDWLEAGGDVELLRNMEQDPKILTSLTKGSFTDITDKEGVSLTRLTSTDICQQTTRGNIIWKLVDEWLPEHEGEKFDLDTICRQLDISNRDDRHRVVKKLSYEVLHENLEKSDRLYLYINKTFKCIDWVNAPSSPPLNVTFPYGIDDKTHFGFENAVISAGDIIVIAGLSNMGKTTWALNFLWENMDKYPCTLMGNEYTAGKFRRRVARMDWHNPLTSAGNSKFDLIERRSDWKSIIKPNNINIIDWINLDDNFFKIGSIIEGIQSKLQAGIAVVLIQKSENKGLGMGGGFSEHLASLYLTIDFEKLTVRKCKEYIGHNPNLEMYKFQITNGGTKFADIHKVAKCKQCGGSGHYRLGDCDKCSGTGVVDSI
jgi:hypothetical protein